MKYFPSRRTIWISGVSLIFLSVGLGMIPDQGEMHPRPPNFIRISATITAYSPDPSQTNSMPFQMASGRIAGVYDLWGLRYIAVSRDLREEYNIRYGDKIFIEFEVQDLMGNTARDQPITQSIDLFMRNRQLAINFGRQTRDIIIFRN